MDQITSTTVADWLCERVAEFLDTDPEQIDPDRPLAEYGLDSVYALALCGDIEDEFGIEVEPTLAWDHPTVRAMASHLTSVRSEVGAG